MVGSWSRGIRGIVLALVAAGGPLTAAAQPLPTGRDQIAFSYAPLVKKVSPAVVNIYTTTTARVQRRLPFPIPGMPQDGSRMQNSLGSGVIVRKDGVIVTNHHVLLGGDRFLVSFANRQGQFDGELVGIAPTISISVPGTVTTASAVNLTATAADSVGVNTPVRMPPRMITGRISAGIASIVAR